MKVIPYDNKNAGIKALFTDMTKIRWDIQQEEKNNPTWTWVHGDSTGWAADARFLLFIF